jgi:hypothetical protein
VSVCTVNGWIDKKRGCPWVDRMLSGISDQNITAVAGLESGPSPSDPFLFIFIYFTLGRDKGGLAGRVEISASRNALGTSLTIPGSRSELIASPSTAWLMPRRFVDTRPSLTSRYSDMFFLIPLISGGTHVSASPVFTPFPTPG